MSLWIAATAGQPPYQAFRSWLLVGSITLGMCLHWLPAVAARQLDVGLFAAIMVTLLAVTWDAFRFGIYGYLVAMLRPHGWLGKSASGTLVWPTLWVALEWVWPHLFPWRIGQSQLGWLAFCQIAEVTGVYGVSFLFMWGAAVAAKVCRTWNIPTATAERRSLSWQALACCIVLAANVGWGTWRMRQVEANAASQPVLKLALAQPGARGENMLPTLRRLSQEARDGADLVVWGESTVGNYSAELKTFTSVDELRAAASEEASDERPCPALGCPLLCAGSSFTPATKHIGPFWNTAFLIGGDETILSRYHKRVLMPWGEYAVGQQWIPGLRDLLTGRTSWTAGNSSTPLALDHRTKLGVLICYEDLMPAPARQTVLEGANVLVNLNNLAVFSHTAALLQHQLLARFRAIENRRWLVRCGTVGSTAVIAATGRLESQAPTNTPATLIATVPLVDARTFYTQCGDVFAWLCAGLSVLLLIAAVAKSRLSPAKQ